MKKKINVRNKIRIIKQMNKEPKKINNLKNTKQGRNIVPSAARH